MQKTYLSKRAIKYKLNFLGFDNNKNSGCYVPLLVCFNTSLAFEMAHCYVWHIKYLLLMKTQYICPCIGANFTCESEKYLYIFWRISD